MREGRHQLSTLDIRVTPNSLHKESITMNHHHHHHNVEADSTGTSTTTNNDLMELEMAAAPQPSTPTPRSPSPLQQQQQGTTSTSPSNKSNDLRRSSNHRATASITTNTAINSKPDTYLLMTSTLVATSKHHPLERGGAAVRATTKGEEEKLHPSPPTTATTNHNMTNFMEQAVMAVPPPPLEYKVSFGDDCESDDNHNGMSSSNSNILELESQQPVSTHQHHQQHQSTQLPQTTTSSEYYLELGQDGVTLVEQQQQQKHPPNKPDPPASKEIPLNGMGGGGGNNNGAVVKRSAEYYLGLASPRVSPHVIAAATSTSMTMNAGHNNNNNNNKTVSDHHGVKLPPSNKQNQHQQHHQQPNVTNNDRLKSPPSTVVTTRVDPTALQQSHHHQQHPLPKRNPFDHDAPEQQQYHQQQQQQQKVVQDILVSPTSISSSSKHPVSKSPSKWDNMTSLSFSTTISPSSQTTDYASFFGDSNHLHYHHHHTTTKTSNSGGGYQHPAPLIASPSAPAATAPNPIVATTNNSSNNNNNNNSITVINNNKSGTTMPNIVTALTSSTAKLSDLGRRLAQLSTASLGNSTVATKRLSTVLETTPGNPPQQQQLQQPQQQQQPQGVFDDTSSVGSRSAFPQHIIRGDASTVGGGSSSLGMTLGGGGGGDSTFGGSSGGYLLDGASSAGGSSAYNSQDLGMYDSLHKVYREMLTRSMERQKMLERQLQDDDSSYGGLGGGGGGSSTNGGSTFAGDTQTFTGDNSTVFGGDSTFGGGSGDSGSGHNGSDGNGGDDPSHIGGGETHDNDDDDDPLSSHTGRDESHAVVVTDVAMEMLQQLTSSQHRDGLLLAKTASPPLQNISTINSNSADGSSISNNNSSNGRPTTIANSVSDLGPSSSYISSSGSSDGINVALSMRTMETYGSISRSLELSSADDDSLWMEKTGPPPPAYECDNSLNHKIESVPEEEKQDPRTAKSLTSDQTVASDNQFSSSGSTVSIKWGNPDDTAQSISSTKAMQAAFAVLSPDTTDGRRYSVFSPLGPAARVAISKLVSDSDFSEALDSGHLRLDSNGDLVVMQPCKVFSSHGAMAPSSKLVSDSDLSEVESGHLRGDSSGALTSRAVASTADGAVVVVLGNESTFLTTSTQLSGGEWSLTVNKANALLTQAAIQSRIKREEQRKHATLILSSSLKERQLFSLPRPKPKSPVSSPKAPAKQGILKAWKTAPTPPVAPSGPPQIITGPVPRHVESYPEPQTPPPPPAQSKSSSGFGLGLRTGAWKECTAERLANNWRWVLCIVTFVLVAAVVGTVVGVGSGGSDSHPIDALKPMIGAPTASPATSLGLLGGPVGTTRPTLAPTASPVTTITISTSAPSFAAPPSNTPTLSSAAAGSPTTSSPPTSPPSLRGTLATTPPTSLRPTPTPSASPFVLPPHIIPLNRTVPSIASNKSATQFPTATPSAHVNATLPNNTARNVMRLLVSKSLDGGKALQNGTSPQYRGYLWLVNQSNLASLSDNVVVQRYVLATFFYSTLGQQWTSTSGWLSEQPECTWFTTATTSSSFPVCDVNGTIVNLDLKFNNLGGTLPPELALLSTGMTRMNLSYNRLDGGIPTELGLLTGMDTISLRSNNFTGYIPVEYGSWSQVTSVDFAFNALSGNVPSEIRQWQQLSMLDLQQNQLSGYLPPEIGNLQNCTRLTLTSNRFIGSVPPQIGFMTNLLQLDLSFNQLSAIPTDIGKLTKLQIFSLQNNTIGGTIPSEIGRMTNLQSIVLSSNFLTGTIPTTIGLISSLLDTIDLSQNQLHGPIPSELGKLQWLHEILMQSNRLSGQIPQTLDALTLLDVFRVDQNNITGIMPNLVCLNVQKSSGEIWADCTKVSCSCCTNCQVGGGVGHQRHV